MTNFNLTDAKERERALDPTQSFIVQAPAGSGKTELLIQRILVLLSYVKQPEEILAITFTKKSSAEMRFRLIHALKKAQTEPEPEEIYAKKTWKLAKKALHNNEKCGWNLLENPNRLQIQTIDSFNARLTRQLPLLSRFGAPVDIADHPHSLYREAVQEFLSHLEENVPWANAIEKLLLHNDNDLNKIENLLINMLEKRDQWLPYIVLNSDNPNLRHTLEKHLQITIIDSLNALIHSFPKEYEAELIRLARFAAQNVQIDEPDSIISLCTDLSCLPGSEVKDLETWRSISKLLLTETGEWRKNLNKKIGFPAPSDVKNPDEKFFLTQCKQQMKDLLEKLNQFPEFHRNLKKLTSLPSPTYQDSQWETLEALHEILRVVVAQLKIVFQQHGKIDYIENAQAALLTLGTDEAPTDLTLALDYRIQHILIDEFQDTSNNQYRLIEKLIAGWEENDGRTLFVVGDPMQSIYRFREAEVGLFIRARQKGIGSVHLEPLNLSVNFRSTPEIVSWVNHHFEKAFPEFEDVSSGAVSYYPSVAMATNMKGSDPFMFVTLHPFLTSHEQNQSTAITHLITKLQKQNPAQTIAILVRSRSHLKNIIPSLKAANIPFRAIDIDPLTTRPVIQDLLALTRALHYPADRIAWLSVLRAPWCGLSLHDLHIIAGDKYKKILWEQLNSPQVISQLNLDTQKRISRVISVLEKTLAQRKRSSLRLWVENTWLELGGPACVSDETDLEDAQAYFNLLEKLDDGGDLPNLDHLNERINYLFASPNHSATDTLQIMTIHNAKGLEFDTVILPHLERKTISDEKQLLQWLERTNSSTNQSFIMAPIHAANETSSSIYDYIKKQHDIKNSHEQSRLLYVAVTRAKKQLHLLFNVEAMENNSELRKPSDNSLLGKLWSSLQPEIIEKLPVGETYSTQLHNTEEKTPKKIKRLANDWTLPSLHQKPETKIAFHNKSTGFILPENNPKHIGILIHQILQQISHQGIDWWNIHDIDNHHYIKKNLLQLGMKINDIPEATKIINKAISNTLEDTRGKWILDLHPEAQSEFKLTHHHNHIAIDRTFIDKKTGIRWIIDYKSSHFSDTDLEHFLNSEQKKYESQLQEYYHALKKLDDRPIQVGLYFPLVPAWKEWKFS